MVARASEDFSMGGLLFRRKLGPGTHSRQMKCVVTPQEAEVEGPLVSLHGGGRGRPKDTSDRRHCSWSMNLLAAAPALKVKRWRQAGRQVGRQAGKQQAGRQGAEPRPR